MSLLQIRNVSDHTRQTLKARAAASGQSLNSYLLALVDREAACPTAAEVLDRAAARSESAGTSGLDSLHAARAEREEQLGSRAAR